MSRQPRQNAASEPQESKGLLALPGLGRVMRDRLVEIGIATPARLRKVGAVEAWRRLRFAHGRRVTITWIYALDVAIRGIAWKDLTAERAARLRKEAETIIAGFDNSARPTKWSPKPVKRV